MSSVFLLVKGAGHSQIYINYRYNLLTGMSPHCIADLFSNLGLSQARGPRAYLPVTYFQFHGTTFPLVLVLFLSLHQNMEFPGLPTFCSLKRSLHHLDRI